MARPSTRPFIRHYATGDWAKRAVCGALLSRVHYEESVERVTCKSCLELLPKSPAYPATPVERRATVAEGETRLTLLEQHLDEIVKLHTSLHAAERDPMALAADVMELTEQLDASIEAARSATVKS